MEAIATQLTAINGTLGFITLILICWFFFKK